MVFETQIQYEKEIFIKGSTTLMFLPTPAHYTLEQLDVLQYQFHLKRKRIKILHYSQTPSNWIGEQRQKLEFWIVYLQLPDFSTASYQNEPAFPGISLEVGRQVAVK